MRRRLRITLFGWKALVFASALVAAFLVAPYTNLFFLWICFLGAFALLAAAATWRNLGGATGEILSLVPAPAGAPVPVRFVVQGPRPAAQWTLRLDAAGGRHAVATLARVHGATEATGTLPPLPRGVHAVHGARIESLHPFGLLRVSVPVPAPAEVVVHPAPAALPEVRTRSELLAALGGGRASSEGEVAALREWRTGDAVREVHWRASARRDRLVVKERESGALAGFEVALDLRQEPAALEDALALVTALVLLARDGKEPFTLHAQGHQATHGPGHATYGEALRFLAAAAALPAGAAPPPPAPTTALRVPATHGGTP